LPFSVFTQVSVILHTALALICFAPVTWYAVRHWLLYRRHPLTYIKLLGYFCVFVAMACAVSGLVLTYEPLFGTRISYFWRAVHDWTTVALIAFASLHIVLIVIRDAKSRKSPAIAPVWAACWLAAFHRRSPPPQHTPDRSRLLSCALRLLAFSAAHPSCHSPGPWPPWLSM
jgi:hypothetical protein